MLRWVGRWHQELLAAIIGAAFAVLHLATDQTRLNRDQLGPIDTIARALLVAEAKSVDVRFRVRGSLHPHPDVVVVAIDEASAAAYGRWPWSRRRMAELVDRIFVSQPRAVGLDITFTENVDADVGQLDEFARRLIGRISDDSAGKEFRAQVEEGVAAVKSEASTTALHEVFSRAGPRLVQGLFAYGMTETDEFSSDTAQRNEQFSDRVAIKTVAGDNFSRSIPYGRFDGATMWRWHAVRAPIGVLSDVATRFAHLNARPDADGTIRRNGTLLALDAASGFVPSLGLAVATVYFDGALRPEWEGDRLLGSAIETGSRTVRVPFHDASPFTLINHLGPSSSFPTLSARDVLESPEATEALRGKAVLVGVT